MDRNTEEGAATLVKEQQHNKRSGSIEGGMTPLRRRANIQGGGVTRSRTSGEGFNNNGFNTCYAEDDNGFNTCYANGFNIFNTDGFNIFHTNTFKCAEGKVGGSTLSLCGYSTIWNHSVA